MGDLGLRIAAVTHVKPGSQLDHLISARMHSPPMAMIISTPWGTLWLNALEPQASMAGVGMDWSGRTLQRKPGNTEGNKHTEQQGI